MGIIRLKIKDGHNILSIIYDHIDYFDHMVSMVSLPSFGR